jgi:hypothetical protein
MKKARRRKPEPELEMEFDERNVDQDDREQDDRERERILDIDVDELFTMVETSIDLNERDSAVVAIARVVKLASEKRDAIRQRDGWQSSQPFEFTLRDELAMKLVLITSYDCSAREKQRHRKETRAWFQYWCEYLESD